MNRKPLSELPVWAQPGDVECRNCVHLLLDTVLPGYGFCVNEAFRGPTNLTFRRSCTGYQSNR